MSNAVVYCCDSNGVARSWLEHSISSLRRFGNYDVFVASPANLNIAGTTWISAGEYIKLFGLDRIMKLRYHRGSCDPMILFRLVLPVVSNLMNMDRFLYIDCDTEILSSIDEIFEIPEEDYDLAGVLDFANFRKKHCTKLVSISQSHVLSCNNARYRLRRNLYVNSGVLMFYPKNIRTRHSYVKKIDNLMDAMVGRKLFWDQDLINLGFKINLIDKKWNGLMDMKEKTIAYGSKIAHFIGKDKLMSYPPEWRYDNCMVTQRGDERMRAGISEVAEYTFNVIGHPFTMSEIGVYRGESTELFLKSGHIKKIYCVDPWQSGYDSSDAASNSDMSAVEAEFDRMAGRWPTYIRKHKGTVDDFKPDVLPVEFIYIDACHQYESVRHDIEWALSIKPIVVGGHDYGCAYYPGVQKAVDEMLGKPDAVFSDGSWVKTLFTPTDRFVV